jgi:hypothetical protein
MPNRYNKYYYPKGTFICLLCGNDMARRTPAGFDITCSCGGKMEPLLFNILKDEK